MVQFPLSLAFTSPLRFAAVAIETLAAAVALSFALDLAVAEPPERVHPVAWFGRLVGAVDRNWSFFSPGLGGGVAALALPLSTAAVVAGGVLAAGRVRPVAATALAGVALFSTTSLRMLVGVADEVIEQSGPNTERARERMRALAGRDPAELSPAQIRSAATESAAENLADGLVAPLSGFALVGTGAVALGVGTTAAMAGGAGAAAWVKAVNTMDSMLGYPHEPTGTASARLDDLVMWVPARTSAVLIAISATSPRALVRARGWAGTPASPNSGWPMATLAAAIGVSLEKPGAYAIEAGDALPSPAEAGRGVRVVAVAGGLAYLLAVAVAAAPSVVAVASPPSMVGVAGVAGAVGVAGVPGVASVAGVAIHRGGIGP